MTTTATPSRITEHIGVRVLGVTEAKGGQGPTIEAQLIRAGMSLNRRFYPAEVLRRGVGLYEGKKVMLDHASFFEPESVRNIAAIITNAGWDSDENAVTATIRPATELESGKLLLDLARAQQRYRNENAIGEDEHLFGFSHVAIVQGEMVEPEDGETPPYLDVQEIVDIVSTDAVAFPAAGGAMKGMSESRRRTLVDQLRSEGVLHTEPPESAPDDRERAPARRKVETMTQKAKRVFDTSDIVVKIEGVDRNDIEPALQMAANIGYQQAGQEAAEHAATLEASVARLEGERDAAQAELAKYQKREQHAEMLRSLDGKMAEAGIPEAARPRLLERITKAEMDEKAAQNVIEAYAEGLRGKLADVKGKEDPDVDEATQAADLDPMEEAKAVGEAFERQFYPVPPTDPAN